MPGRDGKAGSPIELESRAWVPQTWEGHTSTAALDVFFLRPPMQFLSGVDSNVKNNDPSLIEPLAAQ
jgi:hypothetical protein